MEWQSALITRIICEICPEKDTYSIVNTINYYYYVQKKNKGYDNRILQINHMLPELVVELFFLSKELYGGTIMLLPYIV